MFFEKYSHKKDTHVKKRRYILLILLLYFIFSKSSRDRQKDVSDCSETRNTF